MWYGYRKWRATAEHIVAKHCRSQALTYRRIAAEQKRLEEKESKKTKAA